MTPPFEFRSLDARRLVRAVGVVLVAACSSTSGPDDEELRFGAARLELDVPFCGGVDPAQRLDLYFPKRSIARPTPVVLHVHGGGWFRGDKATGPWFVLVAEALVERGYVVASTNYRLAPTHEWPAQIEDVACAVRHLRENAMRYGIDPQRIGVWGNSAGGHLAAYLAVTDAFSGPGASSRPQAVVALYGIFDLTRADFPPVTAFVIEGTFGSPPGSGDPVLEQASPISFVTPDDPPFLLVHGREDFIVPPEQSQLFFDRLAPAGVPAELLIVDRAGHELVEVGGPIVPSEGEITRRIVTFYDARLAP